ncbi:hypothetical protein ACFRJ9_15490 [Paenarthrobacter sp. NPDC056912]|uniref:hypothetical protein n=1 Tax=Paenarthrobacter sp. NPDC056912 TaxID=3345965 RepID=UPI0036720AFE
MPDHILGSGKRQRNRSSCEIGADNALMDFLVPVRQTSEGVSWIFTDLEPALKVRHIGLALLVLSLSACSGAADVSAATSAPAGEAFTTPAPTPMPTLILPEAAGVAYLAAVCPMNEAGTTLNATMQANPVDIVAAKRDAGLYRDSLRSVIQQMSAPPAAWPAAVEKDVSDFIEGLYAEMSQAETLSAIETREGIIASWNAWNDPSQPYPAHVASQKIRLKLGLPADSKASCA